MPASGRSRQTEQGRYPIIRPYTSGSGVSLQYASSVLRLLVSARIRSLRHRLGSCFRGGYTVSFRSKHVSTGSAGNGRLRRGSRSVARSPYASSHVLNLRDVTTHFGTRPHNTAGYRTARSRYVGSGNDHTTRGGMRQHARGTHTSSRSAASTHQTEYSLVFHIRP